jgi:hypothetical protein
MYSFAAAPPVELATQSTNPATSAVAHRRFDAIATLSL